MAMPVSSNMCPPGWPLRAEDPDDPAEVPGACVEYVLLGEDTLDYLADLGDVQRHGAVAGLSSPTGRHGWHARCAHSAYSSKPKLEAVRVRMTNFPVLR